MRNNQEETTSNNGQPVEIEMYDIDYGYVLRVVWKRYKFSADNCWRYVLQPLHVELIKQDAEGEFRCNRT